MTRLLFKLPWFASAPAIVLSAVLLALALNYLLSDYFVRTFIDDPDPLASAVNQLATDRAEVAKGTFRDGEPGHNGKGTARLLRGTDGAVTLRLEGFSVTNGPDLFVYLSTEANKFSGDSALNAGALKATDGNQNYVLPAGTDASKYESVIIWCRQFRVNFAIATLERTVAAVPGASNDSALTNPGGVSGAIGGGVATASPSSGLTVPNPPSPTSPAPTQPSTSPAQRAQTSTPALPPPPAATPAQAASPQASPTPAPAQAALLAQGTFRDGAPGHNGKGTARIVRDAQGDLILRFENFSVTNGPDLYIYITTSSGYEGERIKLGRLKATDGNQNYPIPAGTDISRFRSAIVWCDAFSTLFAAATFGGN